MHFVCSTIGSAGDVFPMLGLALELQRRGHEITFATNAHFERVVVENGLPFEELGTAEQYAASIRNPDLWKPRKAFGHVFNSFRPVLKRQYDLYAQFSNATDVVGVTNCFGFGAFNVRDQFGLPVITVHLQPAVLWSDIHPPSLPGLWGPRWLKSLLYGIGERVVIDGAVCPFLNSWRAELGLPPVRKVTRWWNSPDGVLGLFPDWYAPLQPDWPANIVLTDFPLWNHRSNSALSPDVEEFLRRGDAPIVFTPGSANVHGREFFEAAVHACRELDRRGILLTNFAEQLPVDLPESILHARYEPLDLLLPRASAFVHHGGIGSMSQAMLAGIPQVLMPLAHDQFDNAERVKRLQIGDWIPSNKFTGPRLTKLLRVLLDSSDAAVACREIARRLSPRDGLLQTAGALEELSVNRHSANA